MMPKQGLHDRDFFSEGDPHMLHTEDIRIVVIDDDEEDYLIISDFINEIEGKKIKVDWCPTYTEALEKMRSDAYHLYFIDYFLGSKTGLDLLKETKAMKFERPVIFLTGFGSRDIDIKTMESGATDYLVKSELSTEKLERCIRYAIERTTFLAELKARENKYRALFEGSKDAVFIADKGLHFMEVNQAMHLLLQPRNGSLAERNLYDYIEDGVEKARIRDLIRTAGSIDDLEIRLRSDDDTEKSCLLSLYVLKNPDQTTVVHGLIHDITSIKNAQMVSFQAEKMAMNERIIRTLAHEIRNPLNNILLSVEHLVPAQNEEQSDYLNIIHRNSLRINQIISQLLNQSTAAEMVLEDHPLQDIMNESLENISDRVKLYNINVEKIFPSPPLLVPADRTKLILAFTNILVNAVEAMENNNGNLVVLLDAAEQAFTVTISDNGKGIPKEHLPKLFDPFFTLKKNGVGLGLTASYSILQSHKAKMQVESAVNKGTSFMISFARN